MSSSFALASRSPTWRTVGSSLALAASLAFAFQPSLVLAQVQMSDPDRVPAKPKPQAPAKKAASRQTPTDNVSDDLNRRESERTAQAVRAMNSPPAAAAPLAAAPALMQADSRAVETKAAIESLPPTVAAIPPRAPIVSASLTPDVGVDQPSPIAVTPTVPARQFAQAPSPAPVPIQPPPMAAPSQPAPVVTGGAAGRPFGQSQVVPTEAPTLTLEVNKGTALKLPGPAATVFVAAPDIADVQVRSPTMVYVFAKKPGDTVLYAVDAQDRVLLNTIVRVTSPLSRIKGALDGIHPGNGVQFDNQSETIVLSGTVRSALVAEDARRLALQQVNGKAERVISNIKIDAPTQVQLRVLFRDVLDKKSGNQIARRGLALAMISMGQPELAERQLEAALLADGRDYRTLNAYGVVLDMMGRHAEAQARYRQGIELAPSYLPLRSNFGLSLAISGLPQEAIAQLAPLAASRAADGRVRQNLAFAYAMNGDLENCLQVSRKDLDEQSAQRQLSYFMQLRSLPVEARSAELRRNPSFFPQSAGGA